ncbi:hypothetical protein JNM05_04120 [bacterium]|nr:hypothetical protein [bacterium]
MLKRLLMLTVLAAFVSCGGKVSSVDEFARLVGTIQNKNKEIGERNKEIMDAVQKFNANRKADEQIVLPDSLMGLNKEQLKLVQEMVTKEQDATYKGLLNQVIDKNNQIQKLSSDLEDIKSKLPKPYVVKGGDSHYKVCFEYLTKEKNISADKANELLQQTFLADDVLEGFNIWLYYNDGVFGTFVSQGSIRISPNAFKNIIRKGQIEAAKASGREEAIKEMQGSETPAEQK